jgi:hypothetical protein
MGHLLEKTARHQNLDCLTTFEQIAKNIRNFSKIKKGLRADASFRLKGTIA